MRKLASWLRDHALGYRAGRNSVIRELSAMKGPMMLATNAEQVQEAAEVLSAHGGGSVAIIGTIEYVSGISVGHEKPCAVLNLGGPTAKNVRIENVHIRGGFEIAP